MLRETEIITVMEFRKGQYFDLYYLIYMLHLCQKTYQIIAYACNLQMTPLFTAIAR